VPRPGSGGLLGRIESISFAMQWYTSISAGCLEKPAFTRSSAAPPALPEGPPRSRSGMNYCLHGSAAILAGRIQRL
jgi:hypothetical protein